MPVNPFQDGTIRSFIDVGSETLVNGETSSNQQNAQVTVLSNGNVLVVWESNAQDGSGLGINAKLYDPDGTALTGDIQVNVTTSGDQSDPQVIALNLGKGLVAWSSGGDVFYRVIEADGTTPVGELQVNQTASASNFEITKFPSEDFIITWEASDGSGNGTGIYGQRFQFNGTKEFDEILINDGVTGTQRRADTAEVNGTSVWTVFQSQGQVGATSNQGVYLRTFSNTSTLGGTDIAVADEEGEQELLPQIAGLDGGGFVVAWVNSTNGSIEAETFQNDGSVVGNTRVDVSGAVGGNTLVAPVLAALPNDRYVVVWESDATLNRILLYHVFEADGTTVSAGSVTTSMTTGQSEAQVHVLPQGGFITVFSTGSGTNNDIFIVRHAEDGTPVGPPMQVEYPVNTSTSSAQLTPQVDVTDEGEIIVVWQSLNQDGSGFGVYSQRFVSPTLGTEGDDDLDGTNNDDFLAGWLGDDTIKGSQGDDLIEGGLGRDEINGGIDDDELLGNNGSDSLSGGKGKDTLDGGNGSDVLVGANGTDQLTGGDGNDTLEGGNREDTLGGGGGNDRLTGGKGADVISGNSGRDLLRGGDGDDTLGGGGGRDTLDGGAGQDQLTGGNGPDTFVFESTGESARGGNNRDIITDFDRSSDQIDLSAIDANANNGSDQSFVFIGTSAFSGAARELRIIDTGTATLIRGDVDGDGSADFEIELTGQIALQANDFVL